MMVTVISTWRWAMTTRQHTRSKFHYRHDNGILTAYAVWSSAGPAWVNSLAWGDMNNDGDLDLAVTNRAYGGQVQIFRNDNGVLTSRAIWASTELNASSLAWGDYDGDAISIWRWEPLATPRGCITILAGR